MNYFRDRFRKEEVKEKIKDGFQKSVIVLVFILLMFAGIAGFWLPLFKGIYHLIKLL